MATDNLESLRPTAEIYGALLNGLVRSFRNINLIAAEKAAKLGSDIEHETWYPMQRFFDLLALLTKGKKDLSPILFRAGKLFIEEWYYQGPGQDLISTAIDFLEFQANSGGYKSVVRGAPEYRTSRIRHKQGHCNS